MKKIKLLPAIMTILSVLYLIYVISSESTTLVADTVGGDPGGKVIPIMIALFLVLGFLFITLKERPEESKRNNGTAFLFVTTLILALLYVLLTKSVGFIILTTIVLYSLEYIYTTIDESRRPVSGIIGGTATVISITAFYTLMRLITKIMLRMGKKGALPAIFGKNSTIAVICLLYIFVIVTILELTVVQTLKKRGLEKEANAGIITFAVVLFLYVVFKQLFLVGLAPGLLNY